MIDDSYIINVCGTVASGKSTLTAGLGDWFSIPTVAEETSRITLFRKYCEQPSKWAAATQVQFLTDKISRLIGLVGNGPILVDRSLQEDAEIFTKLHHGAGHINEHEYSSYMKIYNGAVGFLPRTQYNLLVVCSKDEQLRRVQNRSRKEREMLSANYLSMLDSLYEDFCRNSEMHYVHRSGVDDFEDVIRFIEKIRRPK